MLNIILDIISNYLLFMFAFGLPIMIYFECTIKDLKVYQAIAIIIFYPILAVLILIRVIVKIIQGLIDVIDIIINY